MTNFFKDKRILITGACGTVGSELIKQLVKDIHSPKEIIGLDINENDIFLLIKHTLNLKM